METTFKPTEIDTQGLSALGAAWNKAAPDESPLALKRWGLVGFLRDEKGALGERDDFSLKESFSFCKERGLPIAENPVAEIINGDPKQGGLDLTTYDQPLDAAIFSFVYDADRAEENDDSKSLLRQEAVKTENYSCWSSPNQNSTKDIQDAVARTGAKVIFVTGNRRTTLLTSHFCQEGSPYRLLVAHPEVWNTPDDDWSEGYTGYKYQKKLMLGVLIREDYARELGLKIPTNLEIRHQIRSLIENEFPQDRVKQYLKVSGYQPTDEDVFLQDDDDVDGMTYDYRQAMRIQQKLYSECLSQSGQSISSKQNPTFVDTAPIVA